MFLLTQTGACVFLGVCVFPSLWGRGATKQGHSRNTPFKSPRFQLTHGILHPARSPSHKLPPLMLRMALTSCLPAQAKLDLNNLHDHDLGFPVAVPVSLCVLVHDVRLSLIVSVLSGAGTNPRRVSLMRSCTMR